MVEAVAEAVELIDTVEVEDEQAVAADGRRIVALTVCVDKRIIEELADVVELTEGVVVVLKL